MDPDIHVTRLGLVEAITPSWYMSPMTHSPARVWWMGTSSRLYSRYILRSYIVAAKEVQRPAAESDDITPRSPLDHILGIRRGRHLQRYVVFTAYGATADADHLVQG
jgi:hypothetical protein